MNNSWQARNVVRALISAATLSLASQGAVAQQPVESNPPVVAPVPGSRIISFRDAVKIALDQNTTLRQAQNATQQDQVAIEDARNQFLPDLSASSGTSHNFGRDFDEGEGRVINSDTQSFTVGVNSGVTLFNGFANTASLRAARLGGEAGEKDLKRTRETIAFTVAANFLALIQQQEQLRVQRENLTAEAALEQQIQTYVDAGARTIADLYQQQAALASARFAVVEGERATELAKVDLMRTLQLDPGGTYEFEAPPANIENAAAVRYQLPELLAAASRQRADLSAEETRIAVAEQNIRVARSSRWPQVSMNAGYSSSYNSGSDFGFSDQLDQQRGGSVGVGVSVPLFDRGNTRTATRRAELQADSQRIFLETVQQDVGTQVRSAFLDFQAAQQQLEVVEAQVRAAERALEAAQDRYSAGASTLVELSQSRAANVLAASNLVSARYNLLFQRVLVDYYVGNLNPDQLAGL